MRFEISLKYKGEVFKASNVRPQRRTAGMRERGSDERGVCEGLCSEKYVG